MSPEKTREAIQKILRDNTDGNLSSQAFRDMITNEIMAIVSAPPTKMGATVMTESASMYDPRIHKTGVKPENV